VALFLKRPNPRCTAKWGSGCTASGGQECCISHTLAFAAMVEPTVEFLLKVL
jgi:hypothetical protein